MSSHFVSDAELIEYARGKLGPASAARVQAHVAICPQCTASVARFHLVRTTLLEDDSVAPPDAVLERAEAIYVLQAPPARTDSLWQRLFHAHRWPRYPALVPLTAAFVAALLLFIVGPQAALPALADTLPGTRSIP
jgi:anti-sigma factor RsiW